METGREEKQKELSSLARLRTRNDGRIEKVVHISSEQNNAKVISQEVKKILGTIHAYSYKHVCMNEWTARFDNRLQTKMMTFYL